MTSALDIHAGPGGLLAIARAASAATLDAYFYSFTKAQRDARAADPDPTSIPYFDAMVRSLEALGWNAVIGTRVAGSVDKPDGGGLLQGCFDAVAPTIVPHGAATATLPAIRGMTMAGLARALLAAPPSVAARIDRWWSFATATISGRIFTVGPIFELFHAPSVPIAHVTLAFDGESWRDLLAPSVTGSFAATPILLRLDWATFGPLAAGLRAELSATLDGMIETITLDLSTMTLEAAP